MSETFTQEAGQKFDFYEFSSTLASITELLDRESELLGTMRVAEAKKLHAKKEELTKQLERQKSLLGESGNLYERLSNEQVDRLRAQSAEFNNSMQTYQKTLFQVSTVNCEIISMIASSVKDQIRRQTTYRNFRSAVPAKDSLVPSVNFSKQI